MRFSYILIIFSECNKSRWSLQLASNLNWPTVYKCHWPGNSKSLVNKGTQCMGYYYEKSKTSELKLFVGLLCCSKVLVKSCYFSVFFCNVDTQKVFLVWALYYTYCQKISQCWENKLLSVRCVMQICTTSDTLCRRGGWRE